MDEYYDEEMEMEQMLAMEQEIANETGLGDNDDAEVFHNMPVSELHSKLFSSPQSNAFALKSGI